MCDRVLFLRDGVIARAETLHDADRHAVAIRFLPGSFDSETVQGIAGSKPHNDVVIVAGRSEAEIAAVVRRLVGSGADVVEVRAHAADLEGIFRGVF